MSLRVDKLTAKHRQRRSRDDLDPSRAIDNRGALGTGSCLH